MAANKLFLKSTCSSCLSAKTARRPGKQFLSMVNAVNDEAPSQNSRRDFLQLAVLLSAASSATGVLAEDEASQKITANKRYQGPSAYGFSFNYPKSWKPNKRIGNKHLYDLEVKSEKNKDAFVEVTIDHVEINSLKDFGSIDQVSSKLLSQIQKSKKGEPVKVIKSYEQQDKKLGMNYYVIELESERDRIVSKLAITAQQLFCMIITVPQSEAQGSLAGLGEEIVASFSVKPNYLENFQVTAKGQAPSFTEYFQKLPSDIGRVERGDF
mmetsp:Transcript_25403/g.84033  ORF Transcript_25403/g.84033 Transcript_25403/m.84033 type:complete len:268 (-) Transcript_25403:75-878(-)